MIIRQPVVVGFDGSPSSTRALDHAADEAARRGSALRIVYALHDRDAASPILNYSADRAHARHPSLTLATVAAQGGVVQVLARESENAALTVIGTRGLGWIACRLLGAVGPRLARRVRGPLLVVGRN